MPTAPDDRATLRELIHLRASAPYELVLSLHALQRPAARQATWATEAAAALGPQLLAEIRAFHEDLWHPLALMELPVDYTGPADSADDFIAYVAGLDPDTFLFYLWGRLIPRGEVAAMRADPARLVRRLYEFYEATWPGSGEPHTRGDGLPRAASAPEAMQQHLVTLLRAYNERVFRAELPDLRRRWAISLEEKRQMLARLDPAVFLERMLSGQALPPMFPEGTPLREIRVIPSCHTAQRSQQVWGYGTVVLLYNANLDEGWEQARDQTVEQLTAVAAALADANRLKILAAIAQDADCYGFKLARLCGISQPAVSRHMGILKRAGLVDEVPSDGRVLYRLRRAALENFPPQLLHYLEN